MYNKLTHTHTQACIFRTDSLTGIFSKRDIGEWKLVRWSEVDKKWKEVKLGELICGYEQQSKVKWRVGRISEKQWSEVKWGEVLYGSECNHYFETVVFLFNSVIYISLCIFIVMFMYSYCMFIYFYCYVCVVFCFIVFSVYCLCVNVPPGLNPIAVNQIYRYHYLFVRLWNFFGSRCTSKRNLDV